MRIYKVGMPWPLEPEGIRHFSEGLDEVLVVEERREIIENQIKQQLFNWRADVRPRIIGKFDHEDQPFLPLVGELTVGLVAEVLRRAHPPPRGRARDRRPHRGQARLVQGAERARRQASLRSRGCPTTAPAAPTTPRPACPRARARSPASAAISWSQWMDRSTETFTHMGAEGVPWTGTARFTDETHRLRQPRRRHLLPLRHPRHPPGGRRGRQHHLQDPLQRRRRDDRRTGRGRPAQRPQVTHQLRQEGVKRICCSPRSPTPGAPPILPPAPSCATATRSTGRCAELREMPGCTAIVYVQTCAAEKRRRRKRGKLEDPPTRVFINPEVCEGCGDCSVQSQLRLGRAAGDPAGPQAAHQPVDLQQGLFLPQGLLPVLRHGRGRPPAPPGAAGARSRRLAAARSPRRTSSGPGTSRSPASAARAC